MTWTRYLTKCEGHTTNTQRTTFYAICLYPTSVQDRNRIFLNIYPRSKISFCYLCASLFTKTKHQLVAVHMLNQNEIYFLTRNPVVISPSLLSNADGWQILIIIFIKFCVKKILTDVKINIWLETDFCFSEKKLLRYLIER